MKALRFVLIAVVLTVTMAGLVCAQDYVFPVVDYKGFDPDTFTYTYQVTTSDLDSFSFGYLEIFTKVANDGLTGNWDMSGPFVGSPAADQQWQTSWQAYDTEGDPATGFDHFDSAIWFTANPIITGGWVGTFYLIAPNTAPTGFLGISMGVEAGSEHLYPTQVPGPAGLVPEPSSLLALTSGLVGFGGILLRRRKV